MREGKERKDGKGGGGVCLDYTSGCLCVNAFFLTVFIYSPAYFLSCVDYIFVSEDQSGIDRNFMPGFSTILHEVFSSREGGVYGLCFIFDLVI